MATENTKAAQPVPADERAAFEDWFKGFRHGWKTERDVAWDAWQARAASPQAEPVVAPVKNEWRDLAIKFDRQRMAALSHLRMLLTHGDAHAEAVRKFLAEPPQAAQAKAEPLTEEQRHEIRGTAGSDLLELAKLWADNKVHTYQFANAAEKIIDAAVDRAAPVAQAEPMEMALCEATRVVLREGQLYRFRRVGDCEACAELSKQSLEAYGHPPKENQP